MDAIESPYAQADWIAVSRISAAATSIPNVKGSASVTAKLGPTAGSTPTTRPSTVPSRRYSGLAPDSASWKPCSHIRAQRSFRRPARAPWRAPPLVRGEDMADELRGGRPRQRQHRQDARLLGRQV